MNKDFILSVLKPLGYTEKEARIYVSALELGTVPASSLARQSGLNRVTTYETLKKLQEKGLVSVSVIAQIKHFTAIDPDTLLAATENRFEALKQAVPYLASIKSAENQNHTVQLFEGLDGIKRAYGETLKSKTEILGYANSKNIREHWPEYDVEYVQRRAEKQIFFRGLALDDSAGKKVQSGDSDFFRETRLIKLSRFAAKKFENEIKLFDGKMLIVSFEPHLFAILTESKTVYETQLQIFEIMWDVATT